ncbi:hypothetical protein [Sorangium sp. So ce1078]|uniref:hypothetical protein n=1 Tax=Sorangium sp. So ce1078 TaxID=3133329 RepID=UPI003F5D9226
MLTEVRRRVAERTETSRTEVEQLDRQAQQLRREVDRFAELSLEAPPDVRPVLYGKLAERQRELSAVEDRLRALRTVPGAVDLEIRRLEREARARVEELVTATRRNPVEGRGFLRALFPEGLATAPVDTPEGIRMRIEGTAVPGLALGLELDGNSASPAGFEPA